MKRHLAWWISWVAAAVGLGGSSQAQTSNVPVSESAPPSGEGPSWQAPRPAGDAGAGEAWAKVAILGDSLSTGAASHPALAFDTKELWQVFSGAKPVPARAADVPPSPLVQLADPLPPLRRLWPTPREFFGGPDWVFRWAMQSMARAYLDTEEYSWGYLVSQGLGVHPSTVLLAGENGARASSMPRHLDRVLEATGGVWPERLFVFYTGNDLCGRTLNEVTAADDFEKALGQGFSYLLRNGQPGPAGVDVYVPSYLGVLQLLHGEDILNKRVRAFGDTPTCRELRAQGFRPKDPLTYDPGLPPSAWYFARMMPPNPAAFCPTLFGPAGPGQDELVSLLANRIRDYREREARAVSAAGEAARRAGLAVRFHLVHQTAELTFAAEDVAEDCFHLTPRGQLKVAEAVLRSLK